MFKKQFLYAVLVLLFTAVTFSSCDESNEPKLDNKKDPNLKALPTYTARMDDIFEVESGNMSFKEILSNTNEYGHIWDMRIDKERNFLYAMTTTDLIKINLNTNQYGSILNLQDVDYEDMFRGGIPINGVPLLSIAHNGDVYIATRTNPYGAIADIKNWIKVDVKTYKAEIIGKTLNTLFNAYKASNNKYYIAEFTHAERPAQYTVRAYDANLENPVIVENKGSSLTLRNARSNYVGNIFEINNKVRFLYSTGHYMDVVGETPGEVKALNVDKDVAYDEDHLWLWCIGIDYAGKDYYLLNSLNGRFGITKKAEYILAKAIGDIDNDFKKIGKFNIIQSFEYNNKEYYMAAEANVYNVFVTDKNGDMYLLMHHPYGPTAPYDLGETYGGIYKIMLK